MKPSDREQGNADFLTGSFVTIPHLLFKRFSQIGLTPQDVVLLTQILAAMQIDKVDFLTPKELSELCGMDARDVSERVGYLVTNGYLAIGERLDEYGTHSNYFDMKPLWTRLRGQDPLKDTTREWRKDTVTLFEEEFGRPLSGLECEQIRQWTERDGHADWIMIEALREAVLANKYSFKYIDRVLYDWQKNRVRTKAELETYRQSYRERFKGREEVATASAPGVPSKRLHPVGDKSKSNGQRDERYTAFYQLFPDS
jgi:DNA replication protein